MPLEILHLCDSLFPIGAFAHSDGLEAATAAIGPATVAEGIAHLSAWLDVTVNDAIGRLEGPGVWLAWEAVRSSDVEALIRLDAELTALRPSSSARQSTRAMGLRLVTTWQAMHPDSRLELLLSLARRGAIGPVLPVAFAGACACRNIAQRTAVESFAYTRLASAVSAAMRLMPIGQTDAHVLLARVVARVPAAVDRIALGARPESFTPQMDIAAMTQQYMHSRLFRS